MGLFDLFRPKWKNSNPDVRVEAARQLTDQDVLKEMAAKDRDWFVRHRVFEMICNQKLGNEVYAYLVKSSFDEEIRRKAVKKLTDENVLQEVAKTDKYRYIREAAEHRLEELRSNVFGEKPNDQSRPVQTSG